MRVLILCDIEPLVSGTRALQMSKVIRALEKSGERSDRDVELFLLSRAQLERKSKAGEWRAVAASRRDVVFCSSETESHSIASKCASIWRSAYEKVSRNAPFVARATATAVDAIESFRPDVVMTVANPMFWHRVGLAIKGRYPKLPWAAFFSDPRPLGLLPRPFRRRSIANYYKANLSRRILESANAIIAPNKYMLGWMEERLGVALGDRKFVIPHCGEVATRAPEMDSDELRGWLLHVGSLFGGQVTPELLLAIRNVAESHPIEFNGVKCVGRIAPSAQKKIDSLGVAPYVKNIGRVSPDEACALIAAADATLLADTPAETGYFLHSKFGDYAVNGRPILAVGPKKSPMKDYLDACGGGIATTHDQRAIERALIRLFVKRYNCGAPHGDTESASELATSFLPNSIARAYCSAFQNILNGRSTSVRQGAFHRIDAGVSVARNVRGASTNSGTESL